MKYFVPENSVVREIWGKSDTVLFIFAGAAAEFALNKEVDWLYYTGRLPADPIERLFSTIGYAKKIVFEELETANETVDKINLIHASLETSRGQIIPAWAYRDVLFMLIYYSIRSFELLERKLSDEEKEEVYDVFHRVGSRMNIEELPENYTHWLKIRKQHLYNDLHNSHYTEDLFKQYKKHLGRLRYFLLLEVQSLMVPPKVKELLNLKKISWLDPFVPLYKLSRKIKADWFIKSMLLPAAYRRQIRALDVKTYPGT